MAKGDYRDIQTGRGEAYYPSVHREATYQGKPNGKYECGIILTGAPFEAAKAEIEEYIADTFPAKKAKDVVRPWKETKDKKIVLPFFTYAKTKDGQEKAVPIYDAKGNPVKRAVALGNGSTIKIKGSIGPGKTKDGADRVKMFLTSVQIIALKEFVPGGNTGFEADDDDGEGWTEDEFSGEETSAPANSRPGSADF